MKYKYVFQAFNSPMIGLKDLKDLALLSMAIAIECGPPRCGDEPFVMSKEDAAKIGIKPDILFDGIASKRDTRRKPKSRQRKQ